MKRLFTLLLLTLAFLCSRAQVSRLATGVEYAGEVNMTVSDADIAPFWFTSNKYGLSSTAGNSGYIRATLKRPLNADSLHQWAIGYGIDLVVPHHYTSDFVVQQLYAELSYKIFKLTVGSKEFPMEFSNSELSTGDMAMGINARPVPQIRFETPAYQPVPGTNGWVGVKAFISYGWFTDNNWQKSFVLPDRIHTADVLYHSKGIFFNFGNQDKFPLTFTGGISAATQFGGEVWNLMQRADDQSFKDFSHVCLNSGPKGYWHALTFGGSDPNDGNFKNTEGNHVGSWHGSLQYHGKGWTFRGYFDHLFEDHSQLFLQYGWKDMTWGIEATLPTNPILSTIVMEHLDTRDQTSPIYHDATENIPVQISGKDGYYNHQLYSSWQHWGMTMGNPLILSPIYNDQLGHINCRHNRIQATHIGFSGSPAQSLHYKVLYTRLRSWGTYDRPLPDTRFNDFLLAQLTFKPNLFKGWSVTGAFGMNRGNLMKQCVGGSFTLRKEGVIK